MSTLSDIIAYKRQEVSQAKTAAPLSALESFARDITPPRGFTAALASKSRTGFALIAEIKKASPSKGLIRQEFVPSDLARAYEAGGSACLSVLTDGPSFQGSLEDLRAARFAVSLPVLRKDFMIDPYQVVEARTWGADCILLIMACLDDGQAAEIEHAALELGMDVLIETHNEKELERALHLKSKLIGVNNRNLKTFYTDISVTYRLSKLAPADRILVSESGISSRADLESLSAHGVSAFLVGESLMRQQDVAAAARALLGLDD